MDRAHSGGRPIRRRCRANHAEPHDLPHGYVRHLLCKRNRRDRGPALHLRRGIPAIGPIHVRRPGRPVGDERLRRAVDRVHAHPAPLLCA